MTFQVDKTKEFLLIFNSSKEKIRHFEGCLHLELWQDSQHPHIFTTYSHWRTADDLESYRHSALFEATWKQTKVLFSEKPLAFSNRILIEEK